MFTIFRNKAESFNKKSESIKAQQAALRAEVAEHIQAGRRAVLEMQKELAAAVELHDSLK